MALTINDLPTLLTLLEDAPQARARLRTMLDMDAVHRLPERFDRLTEIVDRLAASHERAEKRLDRLEAAVEKLTVAQQRTEERLARLEAAVEKLTTAQQRTEERLARLEAAVEKLTTAQQHTEVRLNQLAEAQQRTQDGLQELNHGWREWRRGDEGRRAGERYERQIIRHAPNIFHLGQGGSPDNDRVSGRLLDLMKAYPQIDALSLEQDPFLSDLIWWKADRYAVTEISVRVDGHDVVRAARRAESLHLAGADAIGVVIGEEWVGPDSRQQAEFLAVEWKVGDDLSAGFLAFRRLAA